MAIQVNCPHCDQGYSLVDDQAGKKIRCKACTTVFEVPVPDSGRGRRRDVDDRDDFDDLPRRPRRQAGTPVWVWFVIGGGVLLLLAIIGVAVVLVSGGSFGTKITEENFNKVQMGMSEAEVKAILGPPTEVNDVGFRIANPIFPGGLGLRVLTWRHGRNHVIVGFLNDKASQISGTFVRK